MADRRAAAGLVGAFGTIVASVGLSGWAAGHFVERVANEVLDADESTPTTRTVTPPPLVSAKLVVDECFELVSQEGRRGAMPMTPGGVLLFRTKSGSTPERVLLPLPAATPCLDIGGR